MTENQTSDLKPCPFCGGEADSKRVLVAFEGAQRWVGCEKCGFYRRQTNDSKESQDAAIAAWNRRAAGWISPGDRLPEIGVYVMCWDGRMMFVAKNEAEGGEWWEYYASERATRRVTKWAPLLDPPEAE